MTTDQMAALEAGGELLDTELEAGDVLMEVLAEDHRRARAVEFKEELSVSELGDRQKAGSDSESDRLPPPPSWRPQKDAARRRYLTHDVHDVSPNNVFSRARVAANRRLDVASESAFSYRLPKEAQDARQAAARSRARQREHDVIESRIEEAMAAGVFDNLPGAGKPLPTDHNIFEEISGEALAHRILKNAGCAPPWIEQNKHIRSELQRAREALSIGVASLLAVRPEWDEQPITMIEESTSVNTSTAVAAVAVGLARETIPSEPPPLYPVNAASTSAAEGEEDPVQILKVASEAIVLAASEARTGRLLNLRQQFNAEVLDLNKLIASYNLNVPSSSQQLPLLHTRVELERALAGAAEKAVELRQRRLQRKAMASAAASDKMLFDWISPLSSSHAWAQAPAEPVFHGSLFSTLWSLFTEMRQPATSNLNFPPKQTLQVQGWRFRPGRDIE